MPPKNNVARLATRRSKAHSSVTLYELSEQGNSDNSSSPRRSKRRKIASDNIATAAGEVLTEDVIETLPSSSSSNKRKSVSSPKKSKPIPQSLAVPHPAPNDWRQVYDSIKVMRSKTVAPVDTMGCEQAQYKETDPKSRRISTLVSLMLSSQTKDEVTDAAVSKLRHNLGGSITVDAILNCEESAISDAISKVGFWRRKTQYLRQTAQKLRDEFDSDVPKTVDELCSLPGVGPKMAFLALQVAWNLNVGIGVDVHVHRITNRLGWHKPSTKNPEETRLNLQSWLPSEFHAEINHLLVGFGQTVCLPLRPRCGDCSLSSLGLCPSAQSQTKNRSGNEGSKSLSSGPQVSIQVET